ncbi:hypothetical protein [Tsukamurella sp. USMM236]|uniref:hypothetical protein n=1 Tax=Tsukamurella sp. USMM236 TaxID=3081301 RepID=UPI00301739CC
MSDQDIARQKAVAEASITGFGDVHKALTALDYLGFDVQAQKDRYNEIRKFISDVLQVSKFKAEKMSVKDVVREFHEADDNGSLNAIANRVADVHLAALKDDLAVFGDEAVDRIDAKRAELHARFEELRPECAHLDALGAIDLGKVDDFREYRELGRTWESLRREEKALLRARVIPSEPSNVGHVHQRVRIGMDLLGRRRGILDLTIADPPFAEMVAEAEASSKAVESGSGVSGQFDPFDSRNNGGGIPREQVAPEKVVHGHNL